MFGDQRHGVNVSAPGDCRIGLDRRLQPFAFASRTHALPASASAASAAFTSSLERPSSGTAAKSRAALKIAGRKITAGEPRQRLDPVGLGRQNTAEGLRRDRDLAGLQRRLGPDQQLVGRRMAAARRRREAL